LAGLSSLVFHHETTTIVSSVHFSFEGNTKGKATVFGLFQTAGLDLPGTPGNFIIRGLQRLGHILGTGGLSFSKDEDIPSWWISKSRGADENDDYK
jgi:hypothetical protein